MICAAAREGTIGAFRFVHTADIHLDSPLRSLALRDRELAELVGNATRTALVRIVDLCLKEQVDALLIAGDLYDGGQTSMKTARFLAEQLGRLHEAGVRVFIIRGNHDAISKITRELILPESVKTFGGRAEAVVIERPAAADVVIHGLSYAEAQARDSLLGRYRPPTADAINIGLLHTSLGGAEGHDVYSPCSVAELQGTGFDYWGLGHIHRRSVAEGRCRVVMPGMPQGRDVNEAGAKSATLVTIFEDRTIAVEERRTNVAQFERVSVDLDGAEDWTELPRRIERALGQASAGLAADHLVARLSLTGATPLAWRIRRDLDMLKAEADQRAAALGRSWIEKIELGDVAAPVDALGGDGPLPELARLIDREVLGSPAFLAAAAEIADELRGQLPPECRDLTGQDEAAALALLAELAGEGARDVLARLHAGEGAGER